MTQTPLFQRVVCETGVEGQYVVRIHSSTTERDIAYQRARLERGKPDDAKPEPIQEKDEEQDDKAFDVLSSCNFAMMVSRTYKRQNTHYAELIPDDRVTRTSMSLSVGTRIMQLIGEIPAGIGDPMPKPQEFGHLKQLYAMYAEQHLDDSDLPKLRERLKDAQKYIMENAVAVITTPALSVQHAVHTAIAPNIGVVMIDEASKIHEIDTAAMMGIYGGADGWVLVGDPCQLKPVAMHRTRFSKQYEKSFHERCIANGTPKVLLQTQFRMAPNIAAPLNAVAYGNRLINHESVTRAHRPVLMEIEDYNKDKFGMAKYALMYDVPNTNTQIDPGTGSKYNEVMVCLCVNLAVGYLSAFPKLSVAVICFYTAQRRLYLAMKDKMVIKNKDFERLHIITADACQGLEFDVSIIDVTVSSNSAGFLKLMNRLVVAISRARLSSNLVVDKQAVCDARCKNLEQVCREYMKLGKIVKVTEDQHAHLRTSEFYHAGMVDF